MSKKVVNFAPENGKVIFEVASQEPCKSWKPQEAMSIRDMLIRTERGQRLDVHTRFRAEGIPDNMYPMEFDEQGRMKPDLQEDGFEHTPPDDINDITDVIRYQEELSARKEELKGRRKKKTVANADEPAPAPKPNEPKPEVPGAAPAEEA